MTPRRVYTLESLPFTGLRLRRRTVRPRTPRPVMPTTPGGFTLRPIK